MKLSPIQQRVIDIFEQEEDAVLIHHSFIAENYIDQGKLTWKTGMLKISWSTTRALLNKEALILASRTNPDKRGWSVYQYGLNKKEEKK